jgi:epoxyqueuosine reductase
MVTAQQVKELAHICGFELAGIAPALPLADFERFEAWRGAGMAGEMGYLTDHRGDLRSDPRNLLGDAKSIVCVGKLYNTPQPHTAEMADSERGWISRYAWGNDYHDVVRDGLKALASRIAEAHREPFSSRICVDTAPLLERSYARAAGLGWIGRNSCLINQEQGSWFFLGELLLSIPLGVDAPPPDRCGTCRRCIEACPTEALMLNQSGSWVLDARRCVSYLTIEKRDAVPEELRAGLGNHVFGCDICQDVCPWNGRAAVSDSVEFSAREVAPPLERMALLTEGEFRDFFRNSAVKRTKYRGFLRNVAMALGNAGTGRMREPLEKLARHPDAVVAGAAQESLRRLEEHLQRIEGAEPERQ